MYIYDKKRSIVKKSERIFGIRPVIEAVESGRDIEKVLMRKGSKGALMGDLRPLLRNQGIPVQYVPVEKLNRITSKNHQGVVAFLSSITYDSIEHVLPAVYEAGELPFILVLDRITDVRNMGAIVRTAECAGVHAILLPFRGSAMISEDAMKTSAGALNRVRICRSGNLDESLQFLKGSGLQIVGATEKGNVGYTGVDYVMPTAIVMGSEADGISGGLLPILDHKARIAVKGDIASLNVSVAAGIIMFELVRQRKDQQIV